MYATIKIYKWACIYSDVHVHLNVYVYVCVQVAMFDYALQVPIFD